MPSARRRPGSRRLRRRTSKRIVSRTDARTPAGQRFPGVHNTITSLLHATLNVHTRRIRQSIEAALADATIAAALGMAPGGAALRCRYVITDENDRPVPAATYPGDRFRLTLEIQTPAPGEITGARRIDGWPLAVTPKSGPVAPVRTKGRRVRKR